MSTAVARPRTLIVGTDFSARDQHVADVACELACVFDASILLVHALDTARDDEPVSSGPTGRMHAVLAARVAERTAAARSALDAECARLSSARNGQHLLVSGVLAEGHPWEAIVHRAAETADNWVVTGGRSARALFGRTSDHVLRHATTPVLVVSDAAFHPGNVLVATDASELSGRAIHSADVVARAMHARVGVLHVRSSADVHAATQIAAHVREVAPHIAASSTLGVVVVRTSIADAIAEHAARVHASLVVVGSHGRRGLARLLLGSTAEALAHVSPIPVLVVR